MHLVFSSLSTVWFIAELRMHGCRWRGRHTRLLWLAHEIGPLLLHVLGACPLKGLLLLLWKCANISKVSPTVNSLRFVSLWSHDVINSIFLLFIFGLKHLLVWVLHVLHRLHWILASELAVEVIHEVIVLYFVLLVRKHLMVHIFVGTAAAETTFGFFHLGHFLLWLGLRDHLVKVLVRIIQNYDRSARLLPLRDHLHLLAQDLIFLFLVEYLILLTNFLHDAKIN